MIRHLTFNSTAQFAHGVILNTVLTLFALWALWWKSSHVTIFDYERFYLRNSYFSLSGIKTNFTLLVTARWSWVIWSWSCIIDPLRCSFFPFSGESFINCEGLRLSVSVLLRRRPSDEPRRVSKLDCICCTQTLARFYLQCSLHCRFTHWIFMIWYLFLIINILLWRFGPINWIISFPTGIEGAVGFTFW